MVLPPQTDIPSTKGHIGGGGSGGIGGSNGGRSWSLASAVIRALNIIW